MPYTQLFYHIVWATKNRETFLSSDVEQLIFSFIRSKAHYLGAEVHALNGWLDHVHLVVSFPAKIALSKFIADVKGTSTGRFNKSGHPKAPIYWQAEYSAFTLDKKRLPYHIAYIEQQKSHHSNRTTIPILERLDVPSNNKIKEERTIYIAKKSEDWLPE